MELNRSSAEAVTPVKSPTLSRSKSGKFTRNSENLHPNLRNPSLKHSNSPSLLVKSAAKSANKKCIHVPNSNPVVAAPPIKEKIRERKFLIAKKNSKGEKMNPSKTSVCNCDSKADGKPLKCLCMAYESLRVSQDKFFKYNSSPIDEGGQEFNKCDDISVNMIESKDEITDSNVENQTLDENLGTRVSDSNIKRRRDKLLEDARETLPESGRVMHLVKAFETLFTLTKSKDLEDTDYNERESLKKGFKWGLPGLETQDFLLTGLETQDFLLTSENLGLSCSLDSSQGRTFDADAGRRSNRLNNVESSGTFARKQWKHRATSQKPFKLRTELRGRQKQEEFNKKMHQMMDKEEKMRIPIAQGLPWTTDESEYLEKPLVKESTTPINLVMHTDIRAEERAEFDHQVAEKMNLLEQYKMEMERQQKLAEEEEIRRLRKELVHKAQPMPYFDRPFIPRRSMKHPTIPKAPKFHIPQHKRIKCCTSWSDFTCTELQ